MHARDIWVRRALFVVLVAGCAHAQRAQPDAASGSGGVYERSALMSEQVAQQWLLTLVETPVPMLRRSTAGFSREDIARTPLVIEPLVSKPPELIRPLGADPVAEQPETLPDAPIR